MARFGIFLTMWKPARTAPFGQDLEIAVLNTTGEHAVAFPCRRTLGGWIKSETRGWLPVHPTHWREWVGGVSGPTALRHSIV